MKCAVVVCLLSGALMCLTAQEQRKPELRKGVSVQMPVSSHAVEMRAADEKDATVVAITAAGKVFIDANPAELDAVRSLRAATVYLKADARAQYQSVLGVLDALHGKRVALLTAAPANVEKKGNITPPYGVTIALGQ